MQELSLNILDIAQNSVKAGATLVRVGVTVEANALTIEIADNGCGMSPEFLQRVTDPFTTTRTTRKVGLGIPLFKQSAEMTGGSFSISSEPGVGTAVRATFVLDSIDRMPLGDLADTVCSLLYEQIDFVWHYAVDGRSFDFDTREIKAELGGIPIDSVQVVAFLKSMVEENIESVNGGRII